MKKLFSLLLSALLLASAMSCLVFGAEIAPVVMTAKEIINTPYRLIHETRTEDGRTYQHFEPDTAQTAFPKADRFGMNYKTDDYKYIKICYRTNCSETGIPLHYNIINKAAKSLKFYPKQDDVWESVILPLNLESGNTISQSHFSVFGDINANSLEGYYTDIEYVAFFATKEEAEAYKKDTSGNVIYEEEADMKIQVDAPDIKLDDTTDAEIVEDLTPTGNPIIFTASDFAASKALSDPEKNITYPAELAEDGSLKLVFANDTSVAKMQFSASDVGSVQINKEIYKYIKIRYKYHFSSPELDYKCMLREGYNGTSTNHNLFALEKGNDTWFEGIAEINWGTSTEPNVFTFHPIRESASVSAGDVFYIDYIAFFKDKADAESFNSESSSENSQNFGNVLEHLAYMKGYNNADGTMSFKPSNTMTRAEACAIIARIKAGSDELVTAGTTAFSDVGAEKWYFNYITYLENAGLLSSYSGAFNPDSPITRAEFVELVYNLGLVSKTDSSLSFTDVNSNHTRYTVITVAASAGLVNGYDNGDGTFSFKPDNTITRAEVVTVINRALGRTIKTLTITEGYAISEFSDVEKTHWAYNQIAEATTNHKYYSDSKVNTLSYEVWAPNGLKSDKDADAMITYVDSVSEKKKTEILESKDEIEITGKKYYVSSLNGNDDNDGLSPETAVATLKGVKGIIKSGDAILFERGSIFRGHFTARSNCIYGAYGTGEKPKFYGSPYDGAVTGKWNETQQGSNIWVYSEKFTGDVGTLVFNHSEAAIKKCLSNDGLDYVKQNGDFWYNSDENKVYLYLDKGNPSDVYDSIEFNERGNIFSVSGGSMNITFDNLAFFYGGSHGIGCGGVTGVNVQNCVFGWIGGSLQNAEARFGNGVEFWAPSVNCSVKNCYVYEIYDAGITFQQKGNAGQDMIFNNIVFDGNLIERCVYNIEYFGRQYNGNNDVIANTVISNNILRFSGYGWGNQRPDKGATAGIKGWDTKNISSNFVIKDNIIDRGVDFLVHIGSYAWDIEGQKLTKATPQYLPAMSGNIYIQNKDGVFGRWNGNRIKFDNELPYNLIINGCENTNELYVVN